MAGRISDVRRGDLVERSIVLELVRKFSMGSEINSDKGCSTRTSQSYESQCFQNI